MDKQTFEQRYRLYGSGLNADRRNALHPESTIGGRSEKGFNSDTTNARKPFEANRRANIGIFKASVNFKRIAKERMRVRMQRARFVPAAILVRRDGTRRASLASNKKTT